MHDLLHMLSNVQMFTTWQGWLRCAGYVGGGTLIWWFWRDESLVAKGLTYLAVATVFYFLTTEFMKSPRAFVVNALRTIGRTAFSIGRTVVRWVCILFALLASLVYFLSPCDIIPDVLIGFGWIDDALVAIGLVTGASRVKVEPPHPDDTHNYLSLHPVYRFGIPVVASLLIAAPIRLFI